MNFLDALDKLRQAGSPYIIRLPDWTIEHFVYIDKFEQIYKKYIRVSEALTYDDLKSPDWQLDILPPHLWSGIDYVSPKSS